MNANPPSVQHTSTSSDWSGWLLLCVLPLTLLAALLPQVPGYWAGLAVWLSAALLFRRLRRGQIIQSLLLLGVGGAGLLLGWMMNQDTRFLIKALEANQLIVAMLIAVSFLRLVTLSDLDTEEQLPPGRRALWGTLFGGHLIGAVINISAVMILGDRLSSQRPLTNLQALTLLRSFSICAVWSPFFAAMGVVLISAPGAQLSTLILYGLPVALIGLLLSAWQIGHHPEADRTRGFPLHWRALWVPLLLAILVMIAHQLWPAMSVITLVTLISILFTLLWLPVRAKGQSAAKLNQHVRQGLPKMGSEVMLFLAAAVLAAGVGALLLALEIQLAPDVFGLREACATVAILVGLAMIGMHPVTSAVLAGSILMPSVSDPNLLGISLLLGWSLGVGLSPLSGVQISLHSRYGISPLTLLKFNRFYGPVMFICGFAALTAYSLTHPAP